MNHRYHNAAVKIFSILTALVLLAGSLTPAQGLGLAAPAAQNDGQQVNTTGSPIISTAEHFDISRPLRELAAEAGPVEEGVFIDLDLPTGLEGPLGPQDTDTSVQTTVGSGEMPEPLANFDAINNIAGYTPPDPVGDVGPNHYVVMSNVYFSILGKDGTVIVPPAPNNSLWAGFGGPCQFENAGDPIVIYDQLADRWMLTQFSDTTPPYYNCVALSTTGDPGGTYYRWAFQTPNFPDYPKYGVWSDAYYISTRESPNIGAYALNREQMLVGNPTPQVVSFVVTENYLSGNGFLPADLDGITPPPAGSPEFFVGSMDDGGPYGAPDDALTVWEFHVDWAFPGNSTFGLINTIPVEPFDSMFPCTPSSRECIPQPGTSVKIDILSYRQRPLWRLAYRNFGSHESLVTNQSVEAATNMAGIRWYEIRDPNGSPFVYQQSTYAPGVSDGVHRWMGSIAMDRDGNMGLGYSASNSTSVYPSIWYTGRLASDPLGSMPQGEGVIINGAGSQLSSGHRWGDYTSMNVDPVDDCTFWYVNEYYQTNSTSAWWLRVGAFKFPTCGTGAPISDLAVDKTGEPTIVAPGGNITYTITASNNGPDDQDPLTETVAITNPTNITIPDSGPASDYPSVINVPFHGTLLDVNVTLSGLSHTYPDDIDSILVSPVGQNSYLMSDAGNGLDINNISLTFDDAAAGNLPDGTQITAGTYKPTDFDIPENLPAPAPAGPYGTQLSGFNGIDPYGNWSMYVSDDALGDSGSLAGGWALQLTYELPAAVTLTDTLPADFTLTGSTLPAGWSCQVNGQVVTCTSPTMPVGQVPLEFYGIAPTTTGYITNTVEFDGSAYDPNPGNNSSSAVVLVDTAPLAVDDVYTTTEDLTLSVPAPGVLDNDTDADGDSLFASLVTGPSHGSLVLNENGSFEYAPVADFNGMDSFTYQVSDGFLNDQATVLITVTSVNDAPMAVDDTYTTLEDTPLVVPAPGLLGNDEDFDGDTLLPSVETQPAHGVVSLEDNGSFTYTPTTPNFNGLDSFTYSITDGEFLDQAEVTINLTPVNDDPVADAGADQSAGEGQQVFLQGTVSDPGLLLNPASIAEIAWDLGDGTLVTGTLTVTHTYVDNAIYTVTLTVTDDLGAVAVDALLVTVANVAPALAEITDQSATVGEALMLSASYLDPGVLDTQTVEIDWGDGLTETLELAAGGSSFELNHVYLEKGVFTVTVKITDKDGGFDEQAFVVTVEPSTLFMFIPAVFK